MRVRVRVVEGEGNGGAVTYAVVKEDDQVPFPKMIW